MPIDATDGPASTKAAAPVEPKTFASGRFVVQRLLGEGGQKTVYLARDTQLDRDVAIAAIKTHGLDEAGIARVRREAQTLAGLGAQPHIVTMYDIGQEQGPDGRPAPYFVCEYIAGGDLERELRRAGGPLPLERVLAIGQDLCRALDVAHSRGILHRDLKPGNVWLTEDGHAKLGDFGLAMALGQSRLTEAGSIMGTASYMPPEQALGTEVDVRGDLYALGCLLYELVTGRPPFLGDDTIAVVSQHINTAPVAPSWHRADLPRALDALIERLLEKSPEERPQSAAQVLELLAAIAAAPAGVGVPTAGDANSLERLAGGIFVGREGETQQVRSALDRALSGQGNLVLLAGEPGIGKTRLAEELTTYARLRGGQVLWGRCYEGEGAPAYWPWVQAIRAYVHEREAEALRSELGTGAADIAQVVSEVRERLPDLPAPASMEPEQARFRLFDSITTFLKNAAAAQPLVFILDDLHWADKPSLLLLQFVARGLGGTRLLLVGTYRDVEVRRQHPLSSTLAELAREQLSQRVLLRGLSEGEVARFIEMSSGVAPPEGLVATVHKDTEGNPFFVKEVVNLLAREGRLQREHPTTSWTVAIPQSVREVVGRRLDGLSEECNRVLTIAAVIGREFDLRTLEQITGLPGDTVLDLLEETVAARIIDELPDVIGRYSFSHGLIRETLYEELTSARRARLHRQIGDVLEQAYASRIEPRLGELAHHFFEAARGGGDVEKAIDYATRAAQRAMTLLGFEEAARLYEMAVQARELRPPDEASSCELLLALGWACRRAGQQKRSREAFLQAAGIARDCGLAKELALAARGCAGRTWVMAMALGEQDGVLIALLEEALTVLAIRDDPLRAQLLADLAMAISQTGPPDRVETLSREAVDMARRTGDAEALAYVLECRLWPLADVDRHVERPALIDELVELQEKNRYPLAGQMWRWLDMLEAGEIEAFDRALAAGSQYFDPAYVALLKGMRALLEGRFEAAEQLGQEVLVLGRRSQYGDFNPGYWAQLLMLRREQGRLAEVENIIQALGERAPGVSALLLAELGDKARARAVFELVVDAGDSYARDDFWLTNLVLLANACVVLADEERSARLYEMLLPYAHRNVVVFPGILCFGWGTFFLGMLATTLGRWAEAQAHFEEALEMNGRMGARLWLARTQCEYAAMLLARDGAGDRERALGLLAEALATAQELGMKKLVEDCRPLKAQAQEIEPASP